ncbi:hypothetical protein LINGRAHAP2_LOCUS9339, partial [Linum grandiflorum]
MFMVAEVGKADRFAVIFGCDRAVLPSSYLRSPLGVNAKSSVLWDPVLEVLQSRLQSWRARFLSFGEKLVLLES